jgi:RNA polymerase sigma-70 factor (ECF subfamily)
MVATNQQLGSLSKSYRASPSPGTAKTNASAAVDAELVRRFKRGDEGAFVEIVDRYRSRMFAVAFQHLRNYSDAEEIAQDTLVRAHRGLALFRGESSLSTWMHMIARNLSRNRLKHNCSHRRHLTHSLDSPIFGDENSTFSDLVASESPNPARIAASSEFTEIVGACMKKLGSGQREILVMRNGLSQSYVEIGRKLGINIGTVKSRIGRARYSLRNLLDESYPGPDHGAAFVKWFESTRPGGTVAIASA